MRIKLINANTTESVTEKLARAARAVAAPTTEIVAATPRIGPASVEGHYDEALATLGILDEVRRGEAEGCGGYVIACFGDPGLLAARELARGPVVGIAEAAMLAAGLVASGFSIVTTLERTVGTARRLVEAYGQAHRCRSVRATGLAVLDLEADAAKARLVVLGSCRRALAEDGADAIVLGCAGMADLARDIGAELGVPVIDGVAAAVALVEALGALQLRTSKAGEFATPLKKDYRGAPSGSAVPSV